MLNRPRPTPTLWLVPVSRKPTTHVETRFFRSFRTLLWFTKIIDETAHWSLNNDMKKYPVNTTQIYGIDSPCVIHGLCEWKAANLRNGSFSKGFIKEFGFYRSVVLKPTMRNYSVGGLAHLGYYGPLNTRGRCESHALATRRRVNLTGSAVTCQKGGVGSRHGDTATSVCLQAVWHIPPPIFSVDSCRCSFLNNVSPMLHSFRTKMAKQIWWHGTKYQNDKINK